MTEHAITAYKIKEVSVKYTKFINLQEPTKLCNSREIYWIFKEKLMAEPIECFDAILLNPKNQIMCIDHISRGSLSSSIVHPRELFSNAVRLHAAAVILMHNHPSGDPEPSREDRDCPERMVQAGQILGIRVLDHIVFGDSDYYSFADAGQL